MLKILAFSLFLMGIALSVSAQNADPNMAIPIVGGIGIRQGPPGMNGGDDGGDDDSGCALDGSCANQTSVDIWDYCDGMIKCDRWYCDWDEDSCYECDGPFPSTCYDRLGQPCMDANRYDLIQCE